MSNPEDRMEAETPGSSPQGGAAPGHAGSGSAVPMIRTLAGVAIVSGLLIVVVYQLTLPTVLANRAQALREAIYEVIPGASSVRTFVREGESALAPRDDSGTGMERVFAGYTKDGRLAGVAIEAQGQGFQDVIKVIYGYDPAKESLVGMKVLESKETPGLGDKIGKDPKFVGQISELDVRLDEQGAALLHPIEVLKGGVRSERWQIDAITGATISSKAIGRLLGESAARRLPLVQKNLNQLSKEP